MKLYTFLAVVLATLPNVLGAMTSKTNKSGKELWEEQLKCESTTKIFDARAEYFERRLISPTIATLLSGALSYGLFSLDKSYARENVTISRAAWASLIPTGGLAFALMLESAYTFSWCLTSAINPFEQITQWQRLKALKTSAVAAIPLIGFSYLAYKKYNHEIL